MPITTSSQTSSNNPVVEYICVVALTNAFK